MRGLRFGGNGHINNRLAPLEYGQGDYYDLLQRSAE